MFRASAIIQVLIVFPTGVLVLSFKSRLPDVPGVENISVDTMHGVLNYKRPGADPRCSRRRLQTCVVSITFFSTRSATMVTLNGTACFRW